jgi:ATP-dependent helicase/DNAse subunit B
MIDREMMNRTHGEFLHQVIKEAKEQVKSNQPAIRLRRQSCKILGEIAAELELEATLMMMKTAELEVFPYQSQKHNQ